MKPWSSILAFPSSMQQTLHAGDHCPRSSVSGDDNSPPLQNFLHTRPTAFHKHTVTLEVSRFSCCQFAYELLWQRSH